MKKPKLDVAKVDPAEQARQDAIKRQEEAQAAADRAAIGAERRRQLTGLRGARSLITGQSTAGYRW